jgi:uncharacterized protein YdbL (DUF1318 family)
MTLQILIAIATLVASVGALTLGAMNRKTAFKIQEQTNGLLAKLQAAAMEKGLVKGRAEGKAEEIQYQREKNGDSDG